MHVGYSAFFQNPGRFLPDAAVWEREAALADLAEPLGFDSVWSAEHHFTDYTMCPNVAQFLTYVAGRTTRVLLGSMITVLPWHDPIRVVEELSVLDALSGGRAIFGVGRGLGRVEFDGFQRDMATSREQFRERAEAIIRALETGVLQSEGAHYRQKPVPIRPAPARSFAGRTYAPAVSPSSIEAMVDLGVGILVIPQKPWTTVEREFAEYRALYQARHGRTPPPPAIATWIVCDTDAARAEELAHDHIRAYCKSLVEHYEFHDASIAAIPGYEYYGRIAANLVEQGEESFIDYLAGLQVWGTPAQVYERIVADRDRIDAGAVIGVFSFGGMQPGDARRSLELFGREVIPELHAVAAPPIFYALA